jgi:hypothetical protein
MLSHVGLGDPRRQSGPLNDLWNGADRALMSMRAEAPRAGGYAEQRYQRGLRAWRSRTRPILLVFLGPFIAAGFVGLVLDGHLLSWALGFACGVAVGVWLTMRDSPPRYVGNWHDGAEGERKTEKALRKLEKTVPRPRFTRVSGEPGPGQWHRADYSATKSALPSTR